MVVCPKYDAENPDGSVKCYKCGEKLAKNCWKCGNWLPLDAQYCSICGEKQEGFAAEFKKTRQERKDIESGKKKESLGSKLAGVVVLIIIGVVASLFVH